MPTTEDITRTLLGRRYFEVVARLYANDRNALPKLIAREDHTRDNDDKDEKEPDILGNLLNKKHVDIDVH